MSILVDPYLYLVSNTVLGTAPQAKPDMRRTGVERALSCQNQTLHRALRDAEQALCAPVLDTGADLAYGIWHATCDTMTATAAASRDGGTTAWMGTATRRIATINAG
jgi:hypothetical protein